MKNTELMPPSKDAVAGGLELLDFSGDENLAPELIDDALNSTCTFYNNIDIPSIAKRINDNKVSYNGNGS